MFSRCNPGLAFNRNLLRLIVLFAGALSLTRLHAAPILLENENLRLALSPIDGSAIEIENKLTHETHQIETSTFIIYTDQGELSPATAPLSKTHAEAEKITLDFIKPGTDIQVVYTLLPKTAFIQKTISITNRLDQPMIMQEILSEKYRFTPAFEETYVHDDGSDWKCPINAFMRTRSGGLYAGVENPYFEMVVPGAWNATRLDLRFAPRFRLEPAATFAAEPSFLGVYRRENIYFFKELQKFNYMTGRQIVMDWGEIWAMQDFMRAIMPHFDLPYPGYYLRGNGVNYFTELGNRTPDGAEPFGKPRDFWIPHSHAPFEPAMAAAGKSYVDIMAEQGYVDSIDWGTIWLGQAGWLRECPDEYLEKLDFDWKIEPDPDWLDLVNYAKSKGFGTGVMDEGGARDYLKYVDHWKIKDREGKPVKGEAQLSGLMGRNCWANPAFAAWWTEIVSRAISEYDIPIWGTDAGTIWWIPFDPPLECFDPQHGHPVGECGYYAWRNMMESTAELRRRHPNCALRNAGGIHRGYPWVLRDWVEYHGYLDPVAQGEGGTISDNIRFQGWHARNLRFIPPYKSGGGLRTDDQYGMAYGAFTHMTGSDHGEVGQEPPMGVTDPELQTKHLEFYRRWAQWADDHVEYMRVRRDILGEPRTSKLDGSAHCIDDRGFIFLFNPSKTTRAASIPLNAWLGLQAGEAYKIEYLEPSNLSSPGIFKRGDSILIPVESHQALALSITPVQSSHVQHTNPDLGTIPIDKAFMTAADLRSRFGDSITIPDEAE